MALAKKLGITLICQAIGVTAMAMVNVIVSQRYGPEGQGYISHYRSTVMFVAQMGLFGLPQALVFMLNSGGTNIKWAVRFSTFYGLAFGLLATSFLLTTLWISGVGIWGFGLLASSAILAAATCGLLHELYRAIALATKSLLTFNIVSIMPAVISLVIFSFWFPEDFHPLVWVMVGAAMFSIAVGLTLLGVNPISMEGLIAKETGTKLKESFSFGFFSCLPSMLFHLLAVLTYAFLRSSNEASAGQFSIAILILTFVLLPLERVMPLLFDTWSKKSGETGRQRSFTALAHCGSLISLAGIAFAIFLVEPAILLVFKERFANAVFPTQILLFASYAFYQNRLLSCLILSLGVPKLITISSIVRSLTLIIAIYSLPFEPLLAAAAAWVIAECAALLYTSIIVSYRTGWSLIDIFGVSPRWLGQLRSTRTAKVVDA